MPYTSDGRDVMLDALTSVIAYASLHTGECLSGGNEATGGSPAYARQPVTFAASSFGAALQNGTAPVFDVPAGTYVAVGYWSAVTGGVFYGWSPINAEDPLPFIGVDASDLFTVAHNPFVNGDQVYLHHVFDVFGIPIIFNEGTIYFVVNTSGDTFKLSATSGGSAILIGSGGQGDGLIQKVVPEVKASQGTITLASAELGLMA